MNQNQSDMQSTKFIKPQQKLEKENSQQKTPQFPFFKYQILIHLFFICGIILSWVIIYQDYIVNHFDQVKHQLKRSFITILFQENVQFSSQIFQKENFKPFQFYNIKINIYRYSTDPQWQAYRSNLWIIISSAFLWKFLTYFIYLLNKFIFRRQRLNNEDNQFHYTNKYIFLFSFVVLLISFKADIFFYMAVMMSWWIYIEIIMKLKTKQFIIQTIGLKRFNSLAISTLWVIVIVTLYLNQKYDHFRFLSYWLESMLPSFLQNFKPSYRAIHCSQLLNMAFLRLLSYGIDRIHQNDQQWQKNQQKLKVLKMIPCQQCSKQQPTHQLSTLFDQKSVRYCYKGRDHIIKHTHCLKDFLNYLLFTPTLLTGPPISYNNYFSYQHFPSPGLKIKDYLYHAFLILSFQVHLIIFPVIQLNDDMTFLQMQLFSFMHLLFIWYKFLIIWKTAKIWSQMYGVNVVNNIGRCMFNNYGFQGFWRSWHRGFNHWLIRYLYIPLGGKNNIFSVVAVISFVAFWHDHTINIMFWALIMSLLMIPEILVKRYFKTKQKHFFKYHWFKYLSGFISSIYIYLLFICNLVGFGYGANKFSMVLSKMKQNIPEIVWTIFILNSFCMLMFYKRNMEKNSKNY